MYKTQDHKVLLELGSEGGSIRILKTITDEEQKFIYEHWDFDVAAGPGILKKKLFYSPRQAFHEILGTDHWFHNHVVDVHQDYREHVLERLLSKLNELNIQPEEFKRRRSFEYALRVSINYDSQWYADG